MMMMVVVSRPSAFIPHKKRMSTVWLLLLDNSLVNGTILAVILFGGCWCLK